MMVVRWSTMYHVVEIDGRTFCHRDIPADVTPVIYNPETMRWLLCDGCQLRGGVDKRPAM